MSRVAYVRAWPRDPATGAPTQIGMAGGGSHVPYTIGYRAGIVREPRFSAALGFDEKGWTGGALPAVSQIEFAPSDPATVRAYADLFWKGAAIEVDAGDEYAGIGRILTGTIADAVVKDSKLLITVADFGVQLAKPAVQAWFAGTGGIEGDAVCEGRVKRRSYGYCANVEGRVLLAAYNIYEFGDPARGFQSFPVVRDMGREGPITVLGWQGGIQATLDALIAAAPPQGGAVVAPSIACVKWWTQPAGPLTADIQGENAGGYVETAAQIAARLLSAANGPAIVNLAAAVALRPAVAGLHIGDDSETTTAALDRLLLPVSLMWRFGTAGLIDIREWSWDGEAEVIRGRFLGRVKTLPPTKTRRLGYNKNHRQQSEGEIAADILAAGLTYADGTTLEQLKPAEGGANVTGNHTAAAFAGQGALATRNDIIYGSHISSIPAAIDPANLINGNYLSAGFGRYIDGTTIQALRPGEAGANITESRVASAIAGQGSFATLSSVGFGSPLLTGFGSLAGLGSLFFGSPYLLESSGGAQATLSAFKTALGIASGFSGQGAFATLSSLGFGSPLLTGFGSLAGRSNIRLGFENGLLNEAANAWLTDGSVITNLGTAGAIVGQSAWATFGTSTGVVSRLQNDGYMQANSIYLPNVAFLHNVFPGEYGANVTEGRTAAAFSGQGPWATYGKAISQVVAPRGNLFPYPRPTRDGRTPAQLGWGTFFSENNPEGFGGISGYDGNIQGGGIYVMSRTGNVGSKTAIAYFDVELRDAASWIASGRVAGVSLNGYASNGSFLPYAEWVNGAKNQSSGAIDLVYNSNTGRYEGVLGAAPSWAAYIRVLSRGLYNPFNGYQDLCWWGVKVEPEAVTPYQDVSENRGLTVEWSTGQLLNVLRPAEFGSNVTEGRTAAAIAGQSAWATFGTSTGVVSRLQNDGYMQASSIYLPNVAFLHNVFPSEYGANATEGRTAAAIAGQSTWATYTGLSTQTIEGRTQRLQSDGAMESSFIYKANVGGLSGWWPQEPNANVTEGRTSAAFVGQTAWATYTKSIDTLAAPQSNVFPYPRPVTDGRQPASYGWGLGTNSGDGSGWSLYAYTGTNNAGGPIYVASRNGNYGGVTLVPYFDVELNDIDNWILGQRKAGVSLNGYASNGTFAPIADWINADRNQTLGQRGTLAYSGTSGRWEVLMNAPPSGARYLRVYAGHAQFPAFNGYQDSCFWDIKVEPDRITPIQSLGQQRLTNVEWNNGLTLNQLRPGEYGANVTEGRTAAAFAGQGQLATRNSLGWADALFTGRPQYLTDVVDRPGYPGEKSLRSDYVIQQDSGVALVNRWPQEAGANATEGRTSAGIAGQGAFATKSQVAAWEFNSFIQYGAIRYDYSITRSDGSTVVTEAMSITSLGISAGIYGQGVGATANNLAQLDPNASNTLNQLAAGGANPRSVGFEAILEAVLNNGAGRNIFAQVYVDGASNASFGNIKATIQWRFKGDSTWNLVAQGGGSDVGPSEPGGDSVNATFNNTSGTNRIYEFRVTITRNANAGGNIVASRSYLSA